MGFERGILGKVAVENWVDFPVGGIVLQEEGRTGMVPVLSKSPSRVDSRDTCYKVLKYKWIFFSLYSIEFTWLPRRYYLIARRGCYPLIELPRLNSPSLVMGRKPTSSGENPRWSGTIHARQSVFGREHSTRIKGFAK